MAAHLGPLVVLCGQDRAGHADQGIAAGGDPHDVGAAGISRLTRSYGTMSCPSPQRTRISRSGAVISVPRYG